MRKKIVWVLNLALVIPMLASAQPIPGCHDGRLTDPRAYFFSLINRAPNDVASDYVGVLAQAGLKQGPGVGVQAGDDHYGITQQIAADGPRGVLFLPTDAPDENGYYTRQILVVDNERWTWIERFPTRPPYAPRVCASTDQPPVPVPAPAPPTNDQLTRIETKVDAIAISLDEHRKVSRSLYDKALGFFKDPRTITMILGALAGKYIIPGN